jgi:hypothetical protein
MQNSVDSSASWIDSGQPHTLTLLASTCTVRVLAVPCGAAGVHFYAHLPASEQPRLVQMLLSGSSSRRSCLVAPYGKHCLSVALGHLLVCVQEVDHDIYL